MDEFGDINLEVRRVKKKSKQKRNRQIDGGKKAVLSWRGFQGTLSPTGPSAGISFAHGLSRLP